MMRKFLRVGACTILGACLLAGCGGDEKAAGLDLREVREVYAQGNFALAEQLLSSCVSSSEEATDRLVLEIQVKLALGKVAEAATLVSKALACSPGESDVQLLAAQTAWARRDLAAAEQIYRQIAETPSYTASIRAQGWSGLGVVQMKQKQLDLARVSFLKAMFLDRRQPAAWYHLGKIYYHYRYLESARDFFDGFVHLHPQVDARVQRVKDNLLPEVIKSIEQQAVARAGQTRRDSAACARALAAASVARKKKQFKTARLRYEEAFAADMLSYEAARGLAEMIEATDVSNAGKRKALEAYQTACTLKPGAVKLFVMTGNLAAQLGQSMTALELYSRAVAVDARNFLAVDGLIRALRRQGKKEEANAFQSYRDMLSGK